MALADPLTSEEIIERLVMATNQSRGTVLAVLSELGEITIQGLRNGRIVQYPNGTHIRPIAKHDGRIKLSVRLNPRIRKQVQADMRARWINGDNIGKSEAELIDIWNAENPADPIEE